jgi:hypothetical protein
VSALNLRRRILYQLLFCHQIYEVMAARLAILEHSYSVEATRPRYLESQLFLFVRLDGAFHLAIRLALVHGLTLIIDLLALGQADIHLCDSFFVKVQF